MASDAVPANTPRTQLATWLMVFLYAPLGMLDGGSVCAPGRALQQTHLVGEELPLW